MNPLIGALYVGIEYIVAKILGGSADFETHFNSSTLAYLGKELIVLPIRIVTLPVTWIKMIPTIGCVGSLIAIPFGLLTFGIEIYSLYTKFVAFREIHKLSDIKAVGVVLLPIGLLLVLLVIAIIAFYAFIVAALFGPVFGVTKLLGV
ncbi:hypothetical protein HZC07_02030 [Candidatus Micrarchaeota archaeon]|nr:hypothetical protein [Candidatus Micrarchaeota archaeon]